MSGRDDSIRAASKYVPGDFSARRWPTMTARRCFDVLSSRRQAEHDCRTARAFA